MITDSAASIQVLGRCLTATSGKCFGVATAHLELDYRIVTEVSTMRDSDGSGSRRHRIHSLSKLTTLMLLECRGAYAQLLELMSR